MNRRLVQDILLRLEALGLRQWCACSGARNSPLFVALWENTPDGEKREITRFFEERSAGFFALGAMKRHRRPVAVLTTSGTAAAELLPAMIEAHYSGLPLVAVTADRPRRYRGTGAPQSIEQVGLYGSYAHHQIDLAGDEVLPPDFWNGRGTLHINVCFEEPLLGGAQPSPAKPVANTGTVNSGLAFDFEQTARELEAFLNRCHRPLVLVGPLAPEERAAVRAFLPRISAPILAETASGLRSDPELDRWELRCGERAVQRWLQTNPQSFDGVLRLGGVPVSRLWRDLEDRLSYLPVLSLSSLPFCGLSRGTLVQTPLVGSLDEIGGPSGWPAPELERLREWDRQHYAEVTALLESEPRSETGMIRALSRLVPQDSPLYLGNSLPIREWDLASVTSGSQRPVGVNRGANGIDGQLSTFLGFCPPDGKRSWAVLGDLTTLYDLSAPWILDQLPEVLFALAIVNNGGGRIFSRMFRQREFQNPHHTRFQSWAELWHLPYECWKEIPSRWESSASAVLELLPDNEASDRFWTEYEALWSR